MSELSRSPTNELEGMIVAETERALLIKFKSGKQTWIPKSTIQSKFTSDKTIVQAFVIDTWVLEKNNIIVDESLHIEHVVQKLKVHHSDNIIAIYGIGTFFDDNLPPTWIKNDMDLILIVKSIEKIPKEDWERKFWPQKIDYYDVFTGYNTLEMYQDKKKFKEHSGANYKWALIEIKVPENSKLLYGKDVRDQLPDIATITFEYDDILARGLYHLEKSLGDKDPNNVIMEFSKGVFKVAFYLCVYFVENFHFTSIIAIGKKIKEIVEIITSLKQFETFLEEAVTFRNTGQLKTDAISLLKEFIAYIFSLLETGVLHRRMDMSELESYLTKYFGGFPHLEQFLKKSSSTNEPTDKINTPKVDQGLQGINTSGIVREIGKIHRFERADGTKGNVASFLLEETTGIIRVVVWNDEVRNRLFKNKNFKSNCSVEIINGYIKTGKNEKPEIHIGKYGSIVLQESLFTPPPREERRPSKPQITERLQSLEFAETKVSRIPCPNCGLLCFPHAKRCPKCGEPLTYDNNNFLEKSKKKDKHI